MTFRFQPPDFSTSGPSCLDLGIGFEPGLLKEQLARLGPEGWTPHYNERDYGGDWRGLAFRSLSGLPEDLKAHPGDASAFLDTPLFDRLPAFRDVLSAFQCPLKSVRFLSLYPNSVVREHADRGLGVAEGEVRIHIPVQTSSLVEFYLDGERLRLEEGCTYYIDASRPHRVRNRSTAARVHLVIDAEMNPWLSAVLEQGRPVERIPLPADGIDAFRRRVLAVPAFQQELQAMPSDDDLRVCAARLGHEQGFDIDEADVLPAMPKVEAPPVGGWVPVAVRFRDAKPVVEWCHMGSRRLTEPFFEDSVRIVRRNPFARAFRCETPLRSLTETPPPAGFIFHMSRCGSTLVAQMFAALSRVSVISEAPPIDDVIQAVHTQPGVDVAAQIAWLRSIVAALGRPRNGETASVVKLDSWHIHDLPLIRAAFPNTPWVFLYRNPIEVLVSQMRRPGRFVLPGAMDPAILRLTDAMITGISREEWTARALAGFYDAALTHKSEQAGLFLNYRELPEAFLTDICAHFSILLSAEETKAVHEVTLSDAKSPRLPFLADSDQKIAEATPELRELAERLLDPQYRELEYLSGRRTR